jgi:hypothetical protein
MNILVKEYIDDLHIKIIVILGYSILMFGLLFHSANDGKNITHESILFMYSLIIIS